MPSPCEVLEVRLSCRYSLLHPLPQVLTIHNHPDNLKLPAGRCAGQWARMGALWAANR